MKRTEASDIGECLEYLDDVETIQHRLLADEDKIFMKGKLDVSVWPKDLNGSRQMESIKENRQLNEWMNDVLLQGASRNTIIVLKQLYTFGQIQIDSNSFHRLLDANQRFTPFLRCVHTFGSRGSDIQYGGYHQRIGTKTIDICYDIYYPAFSQRPGKQSWTIRHMAAYQNYHRENRSSRWIFIQPSPVAKRRLSKLIETSVLECAPALPHLAILQSAENDWEEYLRYLRDAYEQKKTIARHERVGTSTRARPGLRACFDDSQRVEFIRHKLSACVPIIASCIEIAKGCIETCEMLQPDDGDTAERSVLRKAMREEISTYIRRMQGHSRTTALLLEQSMDTAKLLSQIIAFRNEEATLESNRNMRDLLSILTDLGKSSRVESEAMLQLNQSAVEDTRVTKILTFVALLYLPASLVATVFSSDLLQLISKNGDNSDANDGGQTRFVPATQFWIFPVATIILTSITIVPAILFERFQARRLLTRSKRKSHTI